MDDDDAAGGELMSNYGFRAEREDGVPHVVSGEDLDFATKMNDGPPISVAAKLAISLL